MDSKEPKRDAKYYGISQEFYDKVKKLNRVSATAVHKDVLEKQDHYHLSTNLKGRQRIEAVKVTLNEFGTSMKDKRFLDLGCGMGGCLVAARRHGAKYSEGWEINREKIRLAAVNLRKFTKEEAPLAVIERSMDDALTAEDDIERFNVIVCDEVLEHVKNLNQSVATIASLLEPATGLAFLSIPNGFCAQSIIADPHLSIFGLALLDRFEGVPLARAIKDHADYSAMFGEYRRYHEYQTLFQDNGLRMMPLHPLMLDREGLRDVQYKISKVKRLRDECLPEWRGKVPDETLGLLAERVADYLTEADARLKDVHSQFAHDTSLIELLIDYRIYTLKLVVYHPENELVR